jgi:hypothetical protein
MRRTDPAAAPVVARVFEMFLLGLGYGASTGTPVLGAPVPIATGTGLYKGTIIVPGE